MAKALESCKIYIKTGEKGSCEGLLLVNYAPDSFSPDLRVASEKEKRLYHRTIESQAQIVSFPSGDSKSMVQAARASRPTTNRIECLWDLGAKAAQGMSFVCTAEYPYSTNSEVQYSLGENWDPDTQRFDTYISIMAQKAFPRTNQSILEGIEMLVSGYDKNARIWLESHAGLEYLLKSQAEVPDGNFERCSVSFEVSDEDWQKGHAKRVAGDEEETVGLVHSLGCPALRYAAAGFYGEIGDELAIATDDVEAAIGRVQLANSGIVIT